MAREVPDKLKNVKMTRNRTHEQMEDLRIAQVTGETGKVTANKSRSIADEYFRKAYGNYQINDFDADSYHVAMEARLFNHQTGAKMSVPRVQIFDQQTFKRLVDTNGFHGHVTYVLHDPTQQPIKGVEKTGKVVGNPGIPVGGTPVAVGGEGVGNGPGPQTGTGDEGHGTDDHGTGGDGINETDGAGTETDGNVDTDGGTDDGGNTGNGPNDPNTVDVSTLNDSDARALYMDLTGKTPDGRWNREKLNEKIAELQGDVK